MKNKTYCVNKINGCKVTHVYLSVRGEMGYSKTLCTTSPSIVHFEKNMKNEVCTIPNPTQQHKAELHLYVSDTSYQGHENIIFHLQRLSPFCSL